MSHVNWLALLSGYILQPGGVVNIASRLRAGISGVPIPIRWIYFIFSKSSRHAVRPTHPPLQTVSGFLPEDKVAGFVNLTAYLHLVPRLRMSGAVILLPLHALWRGRGQFYLYLLCTRQSHVLISALISVSCVCLSGNHQHRAGKNLQSFTLWKTYTGFSGKGNPSASSFLY
jgi:hypothetical protein